MKSPPANPAWQAFSTWIARHRLLAVSACAAAGVGLLAGILALAGVFSPPQTLQKTGGFTVQVLTFDDLNGNGVMDPGEPPLPWVTTNLLYNPSPGLTGPDGKGTLEKDKPGCTQACWQGETIQASVPPGYQATTPTDRPLTGQDMPYPFGFQALPGVARPAFAGEPTWQAAFVNRGVSLTGLHFSAGEQRLTLTLTELPEELLGDAYESIYQTIASLQAYANPPIARVAFVTSSGTTTCAWDAMHQAHGSRPILELIATICQTDH